MVEASRTGESSEVRERTVSVEGQPARVFVGGRGERLLLVHGGWGGAALHWGPVLERLAGRFQVIAPDLPGIGRTDQRALGSVSDYARWLRALLDALDVSGAWCAGNSFGASVACRFASDYPSRCLGLVLVNGIPMPPSPKALRWLGERRLGQRVLRTVEKAVAYSPWSLERAFFDRGHVPEPLRALVREASPPQVAALADVLVQGGGPPAPSPVPPLLLWGREDHLPGTSARAARKLHASWRGSTLAFVERAGHLPQLENPDAFIDALASFVRAGSPSATAAS